MSPSRNRSFLRVGLILAIASSHFLNPVTKVPSFVVMNEEIGERGRCRTKVYTWSFMGSRGERVLSKSEIASSTSTISSILVEGAGSSLHSWEEQLNQACAAFSRATALRSDASYKTFRLPLLIVARDSLAEPFITKNSHWFHFRSIHHRSVLHLSVHLLLLLILVLCNTSR